MDDELDRMLFHAVGGAASAFVADMDAAYATPGQQISHYRIVEAIGEGGMGVVCKAVDEKLDRVVALKFLLPSAGSDAQRRAQLEREARAASALNHPNICTVHDFDEHDGHRFIVLEYLDGETLKARLARGPMTEREALAVVLAVAAALETAHRRGLVHCDIKPANIFLTRDGVVKVLDFGIARLQRTTPSGASHPAGVARGTRAYMSPEQLRGGEIDARTDIFALGIVLRDLVTAPSARLASVIATMTRDDRDARYPSMADATMALRKLQPRPGGWTSAAAIAAAAAVVIAAAAGIIVWRAWSRPAPLVARDWILVGDVDNRTKNPIFDEVLADSVSVQMGQSPFLTVFAGSRLSDQLQGMRQPANAKLTPAIAREICERAGIKAFITGSIAPLGSRYLVRLDAVNARTGDYLSRQQSDVDGQDRVLAAISQEAAALRHDLGESYQSLQRFNVPVDTATTSSLDALRAFRQGQLLMAQGTSASLKAVPFFQRAIELDPDFAVAFARLGVAYENAHEIRRSEEAAREAFVRRDRVSERERYQIAARYYGLVSGELSKAIEAMEMWTAAYPADSLPHNSLMAYLKDIGQLERAAEQGEIAMKMVPTSALYRSNLAGAYVRLSQFDRAEEICANAVRDKVDNSTIHRFLYTIALIKGDRAAVERESRWRTTGTSGYANAEYEAGVAGAAGRVHDAHNLYLRAATLAEREGLDDRAAQYRVRLALLEGYVGQRTEAAALARQVLAVHPGRLVEADAALILTAAGDPKGPAAMDGFMRAFPHDELLRNVYAPLDAGVRELRAGKPAAAIEQLHLVDAYDRGDNALMRGAYYLGEAGLAARSAGDARAAFQRIVDNRGVVVGGPFFALAHLGLARATALDGATWQARAAYEKFFELWKDADADLPVMRDARAEYARLKTPITRPNRS